MSQASEPQPDPKPGKVDVADFVLADIQERVKAGLERYGTKLQTFNGRNALWDAYQEILDLVMYVRQAILETEAAAAGSGFCLTGEEEAILLKLAEAWNLFVKLPEYHEMDRSEFIQTVHTAQRIVMARPAHRNLELFKVQRSGGQWSPGGKQGEA